MHRAEGNAVVQLGNLRDYLLVVRSDRRPAATTMRDSLPTPSRDRLSQHQSPAGESFLPSTCCSWLPSLSGGLVALVHGMQEAVAGSLENICMSP